MEIDDLRDVIFISISTPTIISCEWNAHGLSTWKLLGEISGLFQFPFQALLVDPATEVLGNNMQVLLPVL